MKTTIKTCTRCSAVYDPSKPHFCAKPRGAENFDHVPLPQIGMVIDKKYRLLNKLGEGGMGSVFRARRLFINDFVAVKFMRPEVVASEDLRQRFYHEAKVAARMKHPNVVAVYDFGETMEGLAYLVMEFLEGQSLGELLQKQGPRELEQVLDLGIQICEALNCMLEHNVIHRDLKPDNIMLVPDGQGGWAVKVVDFGVAKILEDDYQLTRVQARIGSPVYSSPEQYLGKHVDHRTDLYGLGVIFYECLTGQVPFEALTQNDLLAAIVHKIPPRLDEKIQGFASLMADLVQWLLAKDPNDRPRDATEVSRCLQTLRDGKKTLLLYEDERRAEDRKPAPADFPVNGVRREEASKPRSVNQTPKRKSANHKPSRPVPEAVYVAPVFRPRSIRRRLKRKLKRLARSALAASAFATVAVLGWWILSGRPTLQDRWPFSEIAALVHGASDEPALARPVRSAPAKQLTARTDTARVLANALPSALANGKQVSADTTGKKVLPEAPLTKPTLASNRIAPLRAEGNGSTANRNGTAVRARAPQIERNRNEAAKLPATMVFVKDTVYQRGDSFGDGAANERPVHWVRIYDFYICKHEVTNEEYMAFVAETKGNLPEWMDSDSKYHYQNGTDSFYKKLGAALYDPQHPVVGVTWDNARKYCEWLSQKGPWQYRLPTEAEWELAARGGNSKIKYSWGEGAPQVGKGGNVADESLKQVLPNLSMIWRAYNDSYIYTSPAGKFGANAFGLYDMTGNVWEWCGDWYEAAVYQKKEISNPKGPAGGTEKALRGGSWSDTPDKLRVSYRRGAPPMFRSNNLGFRVVAVMPQALVNKTPPRK